MTKGWSAKTANTSMTIINLPFALTSEDRKYFMICFLINQNKLLEDLIKLY